MVLLHPPPYRDPLHVGDLLSRFVVTPSSRFEYTMIALGQYSQVGQKVMEGCCKTLKPVVLELGGKDPFVVCDDADIERLLPFVMKGSFFNAGQNCIGVERVYVYEKVLCVTWFQGRVGALPARRARGRPPAVPAGSCFTFALTSSHGQAGCIRAQRSGI